MSLNQLNSNQQKKWLNVSFNSVKIQQPIVIQSLPDGILQANSGVITGGQLSLSNIPGGVSGFLRANGTGVDPSYSPVHVSNLTGSGSSDGYLKSTGGVVTSSPPISVFSTDVAAPAIKFPSSTIYNAIQGIPKVAKTVELDGSILTFGMTLTVVGTSCTVQFGNLNFSNPSPSNPLFTRHLPTPTEYLSYPIQNIYCTIPIDNLTTSVYNIPATFLFRTDGSFQIGAYGLQDNTGDLIPLPAGTYKIDKKCISYICASP
jgi:hypothetical protein